MDIPTESSPAGNVLAACAFVAPMLAVTTSYLVKPKGPALFLALAVSAVVLGGGSYYALQVAPGEGTSFGASIVGGWSFGLSLVMAGLVLGARSLHERGLVRDAADAQAAKVAEESASAGASPQ